MIRVKYTSARGVILSHGRYVGKVTHVVCVCTQNLFRAAILQIPDTQSLVLRTATDAAMGQLHHPAGVRLVAI